MLIHLLKYKNMYKNWKSSHSTVIVDWLTNWMSLLWHMTSRRWNYSGCIHKCYSLYSKKYSLQYTMYIIELVWIFVQ